MKPAAEKAGHAATVLTIVSSNFASADFRKIKTYNF